ncbi:MAG: hypothetical protein ACKVKR_14450 [Pseudomonadales bacterium]
MPRSIHVISDDGSEITIKAGEADRLAQGAWVVREEPASEIKFSNDSKDFASWTRG